MEEEKEPFSHIFFEFFWGVVAILAIVIGVWLVETKFRPEIAKGEIPFFFDWILTTADLIVFLGLFWRAIRELRKIIRELKILFREIMPSKVRPENPSVQIEIPSARIEAPSVKIEVPSVPKQVQKEASFKSKGRNVKRRR